VGGTPPRVECTGRPREVEEEGRNVVSFDQQATFQVQGKLWNAFKAWIAYPLMQGLTFGDITSPYDYNTPRSLPAGRKCRDSPTTWLSYVSAI
jgi:hypothetical protein